MESSEEHDVKCSALEDKPTEGHTLVCSDEQVNAHGDAMTFDFHGKSNKEKARRIKKNLYVITAVLTLLYIPSNGLKQLQSTLHIEEGLGVFTQAVGQVSSFLAAMFLSHVLIRFLGHKWTMLASLLGCLTWVLANFFPSWPSMTCSSIIYGASITFLWVAMSSYITILGTYCATFTKQTRQVAIAQGLGLMYVADKVGHLIGALISTATLRSQGSGNNNSCNASDDVLCGAHFCPTANASVNQLEQPESQTVVIMMATFLAIGLCSVFVLVFLLDQMPPHLVQKHINCRESATHLLATLKGNANIYQLLLIPFTIYMAEANIAEDVIFTQSYVGCALGIWKIGVVSIPSCVVHGMVCMASGMLLKRCGRLPLFISGFVLDLAIHMTLWFWQPDASQEHWFYVISAVWGVPRGIWNSQITALYGELFHKNSAVAFANQLMWNTPGYILAYISSGMVCTSVSLYILTGSLLLGMAGYLGVELIVWTRNNNTKNVISETDMEAD